jgi:DNA-binding NtrC family response regulator
VAFTSEHFGDQLVASVNRSFRDLPELLEGLTRALVIQARLVSLELELEGMWILRLQRGRQGLASRWQAAALDGHARGAGQRQAGAPSLPIVINFAGRSIGTMRTQLADARDMDGPLPALLTQFAQQCGRLAKRYQLEHWSRERWGQPLRLVGLSRALRDLDRFIEIAAASPLPVLLRGEFGTEKFQLATAIHCCGPRADGPFVQVDCAHPYGLPSDWLAAADGGTLFLANIDELAAPLQHALPPNLPSRVAQWPTATPLSSIRIIASTTAELRNEVAEGRFSRALATELDFLVATIPPIRDRPEDIDALVCDAIARLGYQVDTKRTDAFIDTCRAYAWPENLSEVERVVARVATMTGTAPIRDVDIRLYVPQIALPDAAVATVQSIPRTSPDESSLDHWARRAVRPDDDDPYDVHVALRRALAHLGRCYDRPVTLTELATLTGVSPSHLSALFRSIVGAPFKSLLRHIRILKARERLAADPAASVTDVAFQVGFADLSYFERSFRRIVGQSPREFRRAAHRVAPLATLSSFLSGSAGDPAE